MQQWYKDAMILHLLADVSNSLFARHQLLLTLCELRIFVSNSNYREPLLFRESKTVTARGREVQSYTETPTAAAATSTPMIPLRISRTNSDRVGRVSDAREYLRGRRAAPSIFHSNHIDRV